MKPLFQQLKKIQELSHKILNEAKRETPNLDLIQEKLNQRENYLDTLSRLSQLYHPTDFETLPAVEQKKLKALINDIGEANNSFNEILSDLMTQHREQMKQTANQRRAEDEYKSLGTPDISYL